MSFTAAPLAILAPVFMVLADVSDDLPILWPCVASALSLLIGLGILFNRRRLRINTEDRMAEVSGVFPMPAFRPRQRIPFKQLKFVSLLRMPEGPGSYLLYLLANGGPTLFVGNYVGYHRARTEAERLARATETNVSDDCTCEMLQWSADGFTSSRPTPADICRSTEDPGAQPSDARASMEETGGGIHITIPQRGWKRTLSALRSYPWFLVLIPCIFPVMGVYCAIFDPEIFWESLVGLLVFTIIGFFVIYIAGAEPLLRCMTRSCTVHVSPSSLRVCQRAYRWHRTVEIPADRLLQLQLAESLMVASRSPEDRLGNCPVILARSRDDAALFGHGLSEPELRWILSVIAKEFCRGRTVPEGTE